MNTPTQVTVDGRNHPIIGWDKFMSVLERNGYDLDRWSYWDTFIGDELMGDGWVVRAHQKNHKKVVFILDILDKDGNIVG